MKQKWIEDFKKIFKTIKDNEEREYFIISLEEKCFDKGYTLEETKEIVEYVSTNNQSNTKRNTVPQIIVDRREYESKVASILVTASIASKVEDLVKNLIYKKKFTKNECLIIESLCFRANFNYGDCKDNFIVYKMGLNY